MSVKVRVNIKVDFEKEKKTIFRKKLWQIMKDFENLSLEHFSLEMDFNFADQ